MINNYWEELKSNQFGNIHEDLLSEMKVPEWMRIKCPFCGKDQPLNSIREFGVKLNTRNMGDLFVTICCYDCKKMDTVYFRKEVDSIPDFIGFLDGTKKPNNQPIVEEEMYKLKYNNLIELAAKKMADVAAQEKVNGNA